MTNGEGGNNQEPIVRLEDIQGGGGFQLPFELNLNKGDNNPEPPKESDVPPVNEGDNQNGNTGGDSDYAHTVSIFNTDEGTLSDEDRELKSNLLTFFIGEKLDEQGNLINKEGKVVLSSDNLKKYIEEDILPTDDKGNQVNDLGEILKTKEELEINNSIVLSTKKSLEQNFEVTLDRNDYQDTEEGMVELVKDLVSTANKNTIVNFLEANPDLKGYFLHLKTGGSADNYSSKQVDYKSIELAKLNSDEKLDYVKSLFTKKGLDGSAFIDLLKKAGDKEIDAQSAKAILELDDIQTKEKAGKEEEFKQQRLQEQETTKKYWETVNGIVNKGKLGNITIPVSERNSFMDYISKPIDKEGNSADTVKMGKDSEEFDLMISYLRYKDFDISKLSALIAKQEKVETFRERMARQKGQKVESEGTRNTSSGVTKNPPSLEQLQYGK